MSVTKVFAYSLVLSVCLFVIGVPSAFALPILQVYIEDATYDQASETWLTTQSDFKLWVVGHFDEGQSIMDVRLSFAHAATDMGTITMLPFVTSYGGVTDTYAPAYPSPQYTGIGADPVDLDGDGDIDYTPVKADGTGLSNHGIFGPNTNWEQYQLGDMTHWDESPIGDFINSFPYPLGPQTGEIFAYDVHAAGFEHGVHIDAFNHIEPPVGYRGSIFVPYSHDGGGEIPEPTTLVLLGTVIIAGAGLAWRRRL